MTTTLYVIDARVPLPEGWAAAQTPGSLRLTIDVQTDGVLALRDAVAGLAPLSPIHLIGHGGPGVLTLGSAQLDLASLTRYGPALSDIGAALQAGGDLLLYGCDIAQGAAGDAFLTELARLTQADLAASKDATGDTALGGNRTLEWTQGAIEAKVADLGELGMLLGTLSGSAAAERLVGSGQNDTLQGLGGNDTLTGGAGTDTAAYTGKLADYRISAQADGTVVVDGLEGRDLLLSMERLSFSDATVALGQASTRAEFSVAGLTGSDQTRPSTAYLVDQNGWADSWVMAWQDNRAGSNDSDIYLQQFSQTGQPQGEPGRVNTTQDGAATNAQVVGLPGGGWLVVWQSQTSATQGSILAQCYDAAGLKLGSEIQVSAGAGLSTGVNADPRVYADFGRTGGWTIVWSQRSGGISHIRTQDFNSDGSRAGDVLTLAQSDHSLLGLADVYRPTFTSDMLFAWNEVSAAGTQVWAGVIENQTLKGPYLMSGPQALGVTGRLAIAPIRELSSPAGVAALHWVGDGGGVGRYLFGAADSGAAIAAPQVSGVEGQLASSALRDSGWVLAWTSGSDIALQRFDVNASEVGGNQTVNVQTSGLQDSSTVTGLGDGGWVVTWQTRPDGGDWDLHALRYDSTGQALRATVSQQVIGTAAASLAGSELADTLTGGSGADTLKGGAGDDVLRGGAGQDLAIFSGTPTDYAFKQGLGQRVQLTGPDGRDLLLGIDQLQFDNATYALDYGTPESAWRVNQATSGDQRGASITALADGGWVMAWRTPTDGAMVGLADASHIALRRYSALGETVGEDIAGTGGEVIDSGAMLTALGNGGWVAAWSRASGWSDSQAYARVYDAQGAAGPEFLLNDGASTNCDNITLSTLSNGDWVATWSAYKNDHWVIQTQRHAANGQALGTVLQVNETANGVPAWPSVTALRDGGWLVTWAENPASSSDTEVFSKRYDSQGQAVGQGPAAATQLQVNTTTGGLEAYPVACGLADGGWVIAWQSNGPDGSAGGIYAQRYNAAGTAVGGEVPVNTHTAGPQESPALTALADGGWLVSWQSWGQEDPSVAEGYGVYGQRFAADGSKAGGEFALHAPAAYSQSEVALAALPDGQWLAAWTAATNATGAEADILAQLYQDSSVASSSAATLVPLSPFLAPQVVLTGTEDTAYSFSATELMTAASANDRQNDVLSLRIDSVSSGTLTLDGVAISPGLTVVQGAQRLTWTPPQDISGLRDAFRVSAFDGTYYSSSSLVQVQLASVNDLPQGGASRLQLQEDVAQTLGLDSFVYSDAEGDLLQKVRLSQWQGRIVLEQRNDAGTWQAWSGQGTLELTRAQLSAGSVRLHGLAHANGDALGSFQVSVSDGQAYSASAATVTVDVSGVPDTPFVHGPATQQINGFGFTVFSQALGTAITVGDPDVSDSAVLNVGVMVTGGRGALSLPNAQDNVALDPGSAATGFMTLSGTITNLNAALASGLQVAPTVTELTIYASDRTESGEIRIQIVPEPGPAGQLILGDGSGGGGGGGSFSGSPGQGGHGGGGADTLTGTAGNDVMFGDGSGGGGGGGGVGTYQGGSGGTGGGGADAINGGGGKDILFGDGFAGVAGVQSGGAGGLGGGGGAGSGGNLAGTVGGQAGLGGGSGSGYGASGGTLVAGLGQSGGSSATGLNSEVGAGGVNTGQWFAGLAGGGGFGGATGGNGAGFGNATAGADGDTSEHRLNDLNGAIYSYLSQPAVLRGLLTNAVTGAGNDTLNGGAGSDELFGLGGADTFVVDLSDAGSADTDRIWDMGANDHLFLKIGGYRLSNELLQSYLDKSSLVDADGDGASDDLRIPLSLPQGTQSVNVDLINVQTLHVEGGDNGLLATGPASVTRPVQLTAYHWKSHALLSDVQVKAGTQSAQTNAQGVASLSGVSADALSLDLSRTVPAAEATATAQAVDLQDAIGVLKMIVGLPVNPGNQAMSPYQALAADFDSSGTVDLQDAIGILRHLVGLPATAPQWRFVDETNTTVASLTDMLHPGKLPSTGLANSATSARVAVVGYLSGDVTGNFIVGSDAPKLETAHFTDLIGQHPGLSLAQFGIAG